tara:strand:- start:80 stop:253 length:174 start_codon:yes stop_codon:yes gene_type:complete
MAKYKKIDETINSKTVTVAIEKKEDIAENTKVTIPLDENNVDYQEYLLWVAEGNTPD